MGRRPKALPILQPSLQIAFSVRLEEIRRLYLGEALSAVVKQLDLPTIDDQLKQGVPSHALKHLAATGLRGEVFFPVPAVLLANPHLLGYYRLLYGFSQKEFYNKGPFGRFLAMEDRGVISKSALELVPALCGSLVASGAELLEALDTITKDRIHELQLLTVGPQLRGGANTKVGAEATRQVRELILSIVRKYVAADDLRLIRLKNDSGRNVLIEFAADPDVRIEIAGEHPRPLVSIEIKGGADRSNVHNRLGEAEKSHQKAKARGFFEFWTICKVDVAPDVVRQESPTTTHFFSLDRIRRGDTAEHRRFRELLCQLAGIRG